MASQLTEEEENDTVADDGGGGDNDEEKVDILNERDISYFGKKKLLE